MPDLEKVIYSIERCVCHVPDACRDCAYDAQPYNECVELLLKDVLELLKAKTGHWVHEPDRVNHWHCSVYGRTEGITHRAMAYCPGCGAKMEPPKEET